MKPPTPKPLEWAIFYEWGDSRGHGSGVIRVTAADPVTAVRKAMKRLHKTTPLTQIRVMWGNENSKYWGDEK